MWIVNTYEAVGSVVVVEFDARYIRGTKFFVPVVYVGTGKSAEFKQFVRLDVALSENWQSYTYKASLDVAAGDLITVAIGYIAPAEAIPVGALAPQIGAIDNVLVRNFDPVAGD